MPFALVPSNCRKRMNKSEFFMIFLFTKIFIHNFFLSIEDMPHTGCNFMSHRPQNCRQKGSELKLLLGCHFNDNQWWRIEDNPERHMKVPSNFHNFPQKNSISSFHQTSNKTWLVIISSIYKMLYFLTVPPSFSLNWWIFWRCNNEIKILQKW